MLAWAVFLFVAGMALILAECVVPGGVCGVLGILLFIGSCLLACMAYPDLAILIILAEIVAAAVAFLVGIQVLPKTSLGKALTNEASQDASAGYVAAESDESLIGVTAEVHTALRPAGTILVDGRRIDAVSDGQFIDRGDRVRVAEVHGSRVVVERVTEEV